MLRNEIYFYFSLSFVTQNVGLHEQIPKLDEAKIHVSEKGIFMFC
jgi:hypothetical protein